MEEDYEDENVMENIDDEDEEMVNENRDGEGESKNAGGDKGPPMITLKAPGTKQKRRSKNDCNGRDYVCGCGKTYLSYPALYTHIKTKHNGKTPDGTNANQVQNGRGRGRPRKNFLINEDAVKRAREVRHEGLEERHPEFKEIYNKKDTYASDYNTEKEEMYMNIYSTLGLLGGPTDPYAGFPDFSKEKTLSSSQKGYQPIYRRLIYIMDNNLDEKLLDSGENETSNKKLSDGSIQSLSHKITCDDIFALFLIEHSKIVNSKFYRALVIFIKLLRDCMNKLGWEILSQYKDLLYEPTSMDYTSVKTAEHIPEIANDFINIFLPTHLPSFDKHLAAVIMNHFCDWLYKFKFTQMKLKFMNDQEQID